MIGNKSIVTTVGFLALSFPAVGGNANNAQVMLESFYCEQEPNMETREFDAYVRLEFDQPVDLDSSNDASEVGTLRSQIESAVGLAYSEFVAFGCDISSGHRSFRQVDDYPPQIIQPARPERTVAITKAPTASPSTSPTASPSLSPTASPSMLPTTSPSTTPTASPSTAPSVSGAPSETPTQQPTQSNAPSRNPSSSPSSTPSAVPSTVPSSRPSQQPTISVVPTQVPSETPSHLPSQSPTTTSMPSEIPTTSSTFDEFYCWECIEICGSPHGCRELEERTEPELTNFVVVQLRLKSRAPSSSAISNETLGAFDPPSEDGNAIITSQQDIAAFRVSQSSEPNLCSTNDVRDSTVFVDQCLEGREKSEDCGCARDACFCPTNGTDITPLTQSQFQTVFESFLPLSSPIRRTLLPSANQESNGVPSGIRMLTNSIDSVTQISELEEFEACQVSKTVQVRIVHLINFDPLLLDSETKQSFLDAITNIVNSANRNNCDPSFRQITNSSLDFSENPVARRLVGRGLTEDEYYSYVWTVDFVIADGGASDDTTSFYSNVRRDLESTMGGSHQRKVADDTTSNTDSASILVDPSTGNRRCFCPKYETFPGRSISFEEYQEQVKDLIETDQIIPGASSVEAIVELEQRTCAGDGVEVTGKSTVLVQLNVPTSTLSSNDKDELERACLRAYNQQNGVKACDAQQYRVTACTLSPLYPELPNLVNGSAVAAAQGSESTEARFDFSFSCVGCASDESPFSEQTVRRERMRNLLEQEIALGWHRDLTNQEEDAKCFCPAGVAPEDNGNRPTVEEWVLEINVTGQLGETEDAIEAVEEECKDGVVLFVTLQLEVTGDLSALDSAQRAEFENTFRQTLNDLSFELCDPNYIHAFSASLRNDTDLALESFSSSDSSSDSSNALIDIGYVCYGEDCVSGGASSDTTFFEQTSGRRSRVLSVMPMDELQSQSSFLRSNNPPMNNKDYSRLLEDVVVPVSPCLCDRRVQGTNTEITQEVFNERLEEEINKQPETFRSIEGVKATGFDNHSSQAAPSAWAKAVYWPALAFLLIVSM